MKVSSPRQLKDWINNIAKEKQVTANHLLQNYMMERLLERITVSNYRDNLILKGGFLISSMIGTEMRSTMDMDTTVKGIKVNRVEIEKMFIEILAIDLDDNLKFQIVDIKNIHDVNDYDDFRISIEAQFFSIKVTMKIDITTGDQIIPSEITYSFKMMFEDRHISVKAYNLITILAEKIESVLARNVANTRARDYYDIYILHNLRHEEIDFVDLRNAIIKKADERNTLKYVEKWNLYLNQIEESKYLDDIWIAYSNKFKYAKGISFQDITKILRKILQTEAEVSDPL